MNVTVYCYLGGHMTTLPADASSGTCHLCGRRVVTTQCSRCQAPLAWPTPGRCHNCDAALGLRGRAVPLRAAEWSFLRRLWGGGEGFLNYGSYYGLKVISGWNLPFPEGSIVTVTVGQQEIRVTPINPRGPVASYKVSDLLDVQIGGPGALLHHTWSVYSAMSDSPFSIARGIFAQGLIRALTTERIVNTEVTFLFNGASIHLWTQRMDTEALRNDLDGLQCPWKNGIPAC
ncbi:MAG: hypothetical protein ACRDNZ_02690 [Streptosporangiaceae bacterium]